MNLVLRSSLAALLASTALAQTDFETRLRAIIARPEYRHSRFGIAVYPLSGGNPLYRLNAEQLFVPGSTTKLLSEGAALKLIGPDYRFHTPVYRTGPIGPDGTLTGD